MRLNSIEDMLRQAYKDGYEDGKKIMEQELFNNWCKNNDDPCPYICKLEMQIKEMKKEVKK